MPKFTPPKVRHPSERIRIQHDIHGESMTHQAHAQNADICNIIRKYDNTGLMPDGRPAGSYIDCTYLQSKPRDQLILESRAKSLEADKAHKKALAAEEQAKADKLKADQAELEEFRKQKASKSSSSDEPQK